VQAGACAIRSPHGAQRLGAGPPGCSGGAEPRREAAWRAGQDATPAPDERSGLGPASLDRGTIYAATWLLKRSLDNADLFLMASATPLARPDAGIDATRLAAACRSAVKALGAADTPAESIEAALGVLEEALGDAYMAAFVLEHERLWIVAQRGYSLIPDGVPTDEGIPARSVRTRQTQVVVDVRADEDYVMVAQGVRSQIAIPLQVDGAVIGVLNIETRRQAPAASAEIVAELAAALAPALDAVRTARSLDLSALARLFVHVSSLRDPRRIAEITAASLTRVLPVETSQVGLFHPEGEIEALATWRAGSGRESLSAEALAELRERVEAPAVFELFPAENGDGPTVVWLPLRANGVEIGVLAGTSIRTQDYDRGRAEMATLLAAHAAASLDAALALGRERRSALTDPLTGLMNRRGFEERLENELRHAQDGMRPLSVVLLDCDDFKDLNDRAGHEFGDALLREVGRVLAVRVPEGGSAARLGGDEFVVMLPGLEAEPAEKVANELRRGLSRELADTGFPLQISAGLTTYPFDGAAGTQLLRGADQALYTAKQCGKNRVVGFRAIGRIAPPALPPRRPARGERRRGPSGSEVTMLGEISAAAHAIWQETTVEDVLDRAGKALVFVVGAAGAAFSRVDGDHLVEVMRQTLRNVDLGEEAAYLISDFPLTQLVLETGEVRGVSFLDDDIDRAEAFLLRKLEMNCVLLVPVTAFGTAWGLIELYDVRLRRFTPAECAAAEFLVGQAARRIETLADGNRSVQRKLPLFRLPAEDDAA